MVDELVYLDISDLTKIELPAQKPGPWRWKLIVCSKSWSDKIWSFVVRSMSPARKGELNLVNERGKGGHRGVLKRQLPVEYMGLRMGGCKAIEGGMGGSDYLCRHDSSRLSPRLIGHPRPSNPYDTHFNYLNVAPPHLNGSPSKPSLRTITTTLCMCMSSPWSWQWQQAGCAASESENIGGGHFLECNPTLTMSFIVGLDTPVPMLVASTTRIANSPS